MCIRNVFFYALFLIPGLTSCQKEDFDENDVPVSDAGAPLSTVLPADSVRLTGTGLDADGNVVAYLWSQVSGPAASVIVNPGAPSTSVRGLKPGAYVFQLMVTDDKGATGVDTVNVTVTGIVQQTLALQPANNPGEFTVAILGGTDMSAGMRGQIDADAWTSGGITYLLRNLLRFDLSSIPATATITSAKLYLYSHPTPSTGDLVNANAGSNNSILVQQITSTWSPATANWSNQPTTTTVNQISVPHASQPQVDLQLDVKAMVTSMVSNNANYGFMIRLQNEVTLTSRIFVGSAAANYPSKHPKIVIEYQ